MHHLKVGARSSKLSVAQTHQSLKTLAETFAELSFELVEMETGGDRDLKTSMLEGQAPDDFFTDDLDRGVLSGELDMAVHSAKDLPCYSGDSIDWFFLPWREDPRDAILWPRGRKPNTTKPVVGVSSPSREAFAKKRWPGCQVKSIRGSIDHRIQQMDDGDFDVILLAIAGLKRLGVDDRLDEPLSVEELPTHPDQGAIAITYKKGHPVLSKVKQLLLLPVDICGAGTGREGNYSLAVKKALEQADLCLHDSLMDPEILGHCQGELVHVGKRYHDEKPGYQQQRIIDLLLTASRKGQRVVRLKGGDPSLFGRLSEEVEALFEHDLPFRVLPGIPWICTAPLRHGIYLTERRHIRHFQVATGTEIEGKAFECQDLDPEKGPVYFFMAIRKIADISKALLEKGYDSETPCAALNENSGDENIVRGTLANISERMKVSELKPPALFIVGDAVRADRGFSKPERPLKGVRILTTGTESTRETLGQQLSDLGATPVHLKTFDLEPDVRNAKAWIPLVSTSQWILLSSASAVTVFLGLLKKFGVDLRRLPKLGVSGPAAANTLAKAGLVADFLPQTYTSEALADGLIESENLKGQQVLIPRSSASVSPLPERLADAGAEVKTATLYHNRPISVEALPKFDVACFCSPSSVKALQHLQHEFTAKTVASIGPVTTKALEENHWHVDVEPKVYNAKNLAWALASKLFLGH